MRFGSTTIGSPQNQPVVPVVPGSGADFQITTAGFANNGARAAEAFLSSLNAAHAYGAVISGTAVAAQKAIAELNNPNASGKIVYVYMIDVFVPAAMAIAVLLNGTTLSPATASIPLQAGGAAGVALVGGGAQAAPTGSQFYLTPSLAINADYAIPQPWIIKLPPNSNLQLQGQTVNQAFTCNLRWIELIN